MIWFFVQSGVKVRVRFRVKDVVKSVPVPKKYFLICERDTV